MNRQELKGVLELHNKWLRCEGGECADLYGADLRHANLRGANLEGADLYRADLYGADLEGADLYRADLYGTDLRHANLRGANLEGADLEDTNLRDADLYDANLRYADLTNANLRGANLRHADLDFSVMPLWCGDLKAHYDEKQIIQQLYHVLSHVKHSKNSTDRLRKHLLTDELRDLANKFHRIGEVEEI